MKVGNLVQLSKNKLFDLKILKTKIYSPVHKSTNISIQDIKHRLKKALEIIYKFHSNNRRILFIGTPKSFRARLKHIVTQHTFIHDSVWMDGFYTNRRSVFRYLNKNKWTLNKSRSAILRKVNRRNELIVVLNKNRSLGTVKEGYSVKLPVISFNDLLDISDNYPSYKVPGSFKLSEKNSRDNFICSIIFSTLNRAEKAKTIVELGNKSGGRRKYRRRRRVYRFL